MVEFIFVDIVKRLSIPRSNILSTMKTGMNIMRFTKDRPKNLKKVSNPQEKTNTKVQKKILRSRQNLKKAIFLFKIKNLNKITMLSLTKKGKK